MVKDMNNKDIIEFFDRLAPVWDSDMVKSDEIIEKILNGAAAKEGQDVLDVACGTGVMFDYYLKRRAASVTGIDISPKMAEIAKQKYKDNPSVSVICGDVMTANFGKKFDLIVVYNAFPHFPDPEGLIACLKGHLKEGGRLTVADGEAREKIDARHTGAAAKVSVGLMKIEELKKLFDPYFETEVLISDENMYQISGKLKD